MSMTIRLVALALGALLLLTACGDEGSAGEGSSVDDPTTPSSEALSLADQTYVVTGVTEAGKPRELAPGTEVRFVFTSNNLNVQTGCNQLFGSWQRAGDVVTLGPLGGTEMGCEPDPTAQETWLAELLTEPITVGVDTLTVGDTVFTVADRELVSPDAPLAGQKWHLDSLISKETVSSVPLGVKAWIQYDGSRLTVQTGCNSGNATATEADGVLEVGPLALTRRACLDDGAQEVERAMTAVLSGAVIFAIEERRLTLTAAGGESGLGFIAR